MCFQTALIGDFRTIIDNLVVPLQERMEDWKKTVAQLDKEHTKGNSWGITPKCLKLNKPACEILLLMALGTTEPGNDSLTHIQPSLQAMGIKSTSFHMYGIE